MLVTSAPAQRSGPPTCASFGPEAGASRDRKSTRLNSSHDQISYAVFCLKKNKTNKGACNHLIAVQTRLETLARIVTQSGTTLLKSYALCCKFDMFQVCLRHAPSALTVR